jgi:hypothetical protein
VKDALGLEIRDVGLFFGRKGTDVDSISSNADHSSESSFGRFLDTEQSLSIVAPSHSNILHVHGLGSLSQIEKSIVVLNAIAVVNPSRRPSTRHHRPSESVGSECFASDGDGSVPICAFRGSSDISCFRSARRTQPPGKDTAL